MDAINILLIDDEERFLRTATKLLQKKGLNVFTCTNGEDALRLLDENPIDVALLDLKLPGMGGLTLLQKVRELHSEVRVILLSGSFSSEPAEAGLRMGAFAYLAKPASIEKIFEKVQEAFKQRRA